ncbi:MAG: dihydrolipoyl dehydrogenase [Isosphaeraceae bacterium]
MTKQFDLVVIGAGPGGYVAAIRAAQLGMKVACVEKSRTLGGTCLNVGCIPSKAMLDSSELYHQARERLGRHGIKLEGVTLDLAAMLARKDKVVKGLTEGIRFLFRKNRIETILGAGRVSSPSTVAVATPEGGNVELAAGHILLATGSVPVSLPFLPFDGRIVVDSTGALAFEKVPDHLVVVGAGYIGLELGSVWRRLGAKVTVIEFLPRIVPMADQEMGDLLKKSLTKQGLEFHLETKVTGALVRSDGATVAAEKKDGAKLSINCTNVLVAVGRRPFTEGLGLGEIGVAVDARTGKVPVDSRFRTKVATISAIGDLVDGPMLAHKAEDEGIAFAEILAGKPGHVDYETIPSVIYTWPEMASVGLTEEQVRERGFKYNAGKFPFQANGRAKAMDETEGLVKILADAGSDRVLGVHIFGPRASEMIAEPVSVMEFGGSAEDIARTSHAHPTLSEVVREAALAVDRRAIHG